MNTEKMNNDFTKEDAIGILVTKYAQVLIEMCKKIDPPRSTKFEQQEGFDDVAWMQEMIAEASGCIREHNYPLRAVTKTIKWYFRKPNRVLARVCLMDDIVAVLSEERDVFEAREQDVEVFKNSTVAKERSKIICRAQAVLSEERRKLLSYAYGPKLNDEVLELYAPETIAKLSDEESNLRAVIALRKAVTPYVSRQSDAEIAAVKEAGFNFRKEMLMCVGTDVLELFADVTRDVFSRNSDV